MFYVPFEVGRHPEGSATQSTTVRPFTGVQTLVVGEGHLALVALLAYVAPEVPLTPVHSRQVDAQVGRGEKALVAGAAHMFPHLFTHMDTLHMEVEARLVVVHSTTFPTLILLLLGVEVHVDIEVLYSDATDVAGLQRAGVALHVVLPLNLVCKGLPTQPALHRSLVVACLPWVFELEVSHIIGVILQDDGAEFAAVAIHLRMCCEEMSLELVHLPVFKATHRTLMRAIPVTPDV